MAAVWTKDVTPGLGQRPRGVPGEPDYGGSYVCTTKSFNFIVEATKSH